MQDFGIPKKEEKDIKKAISRKPADASGKFRVVKIEPASQRTNEEFVEGESGGTGGRGCRINEAVVQ